MITSIVDNSGARAATRSGVRGRVPLVPMSVMTRTEKARGILSQAQIPISSVNRETVDEGLRRSKKDVITVYGSVEELNRNMPAIAEAAKSGVLIRGKLRMLYD